MPGVRDQENGHVGKMVLTASLEISKILEKTAASGDFVTDGGTFCKHDFKADPDCHFFPHHDAGIGLGKTETVH
jgi:hypothetical protein